MSTDPVLVAASIDLSGHNDLTVLPKPGRMLGKWSQYGQKIVSCFSDYCNLPRSIAWPIYLPQSAGCKPYWNQMSPWELGPLRSPGIPWAWRWPPSRFVDPSQAAETWADSSGPLAPQRSHAPRVIWRRFRGGLRGAADVRKKIPYEGRGQRAHLWQESMGN